jgi:hypothetical protein
MVRQLRSLVGCTSALGNQCSGLLESATEHALHFYIISLEILIDFYFKMAEEEKVKVKVLLFGLGA